MEKPSLSEVKEHFKDAKVVRDIDGDTINLSNPDTNIFDSGSGYYAENSESPTVRLFFHEDPLDFGGYAEIIEYKNQDKKMRKVIRLDEPKEEKQPKPIELTHWLHESGEWQRVSEDFSFENIKEILHLGDISKIGDMFKASFSKYNQTTIYKGYLNDGVY